MKPITTIENQELTVFARIKKSNRIVHTTVDGVEGKVCTRCGKWHPLSEFHNSKSAGDGLTSWCKKCNCQHTKEYHRNKRNSALTSTLQENEVQTPVDPLDTLCGILGKFSSAPVEKYPAIIREIEDWGLATLIDKDEDEELGKGKIAIREEEYEALCSETQTLQAENERLRRELKDSAKNLNHLSQEDIETVLSSCAPKYLIKKFYELNANYTISYKDPVSGQCTDIRREVVSS